MNTIAVAQLEPNRFYWASRKPVQGKFTAEPGDIVIVQISTVFGATLEFWTVAVMGSDEHFDVAGFEFFHKVPSPPIAETLLLNLTVIVSGAKSVAGFR